MNNLLASNPEIMRQLLENVPENVKPKYLLIPIVGMTISGIIDSIVKSVKTNDCEAKVKIGNFEASVRPAKEQVIL